MPIIAIYQKSQGGKIVLALLTIVGIAMAGLSSRPDPSPKPSPTRGGMPSNSPWKDSPFDPVPTKATGLQVSPVATRFITQNEGERN